MATCLADTNLLLRLADPASVQHTTATAALAELFRRGDEVFVAAQNLIEFWAVATRPVEVNGFGWTSQRAAREVTDLRARFPVLPDSPAIFERWLDLVEQLPIQGKRVHDARLVAVMMVHGVEHLVTFNLPDFSAFPKLSLIDPASMGKQPPG
jgi:predicted nucleic acid-binding protein